MMENVYRWLLVVWCIIYTTCVTSSIVSKPVNLVIVINETFNENSELVERTPMKDQTWQSLGLRMESPNWNTSRKDRSIILEESVEQNEEENITYSMNKKCSRYCVQTNMEQIKDLEYINLFWSVNGINITGTPKFSLEKSHLQMNVSKFRWINRKSLNELLKSCQIYLDLNCNVEQTESISNNGKKEIKTKTENNLNILYKHPTNKAFIKLVEQNSLSRTTEAKFSVNSKMHRVIVEIDGNISHAVLQVPTSGTVSWSGIIISLAHKYDAQGLTIVAQNAPPGEWCIKLTGVESSKYRFHVEAFIEKGDDTTDDKQFFLESLLREPFLEKKFTQLTIKYADHFGATDDVLFNNTDNIDHLREATDSKIITAGGQYWNTIKHRKLLDNGQISDDLSLENLYAQDESGRLIMKNNNASASSVVSSTTEYTLINNIRSKTFLNDDGFTESPNSTNKGNKPSNQTYPAKKQQGIRARSSIESAEDFDVESSKTAINENISMKIVEDSANQELVEEELAKYANEDEIENKRMLIDLNRNSRLLVSPGTIHRVVFDVMNGCILPVRYAFEVESSPFRVYNVQPTYVWIFPRQTGQVAVDVIIPANASPDTVNTLTLSVKGTEIKKKSVYLYVQGSVTKLSDDVRPTMEHSFNNNCAGKLDKTRCYKSRWSVDITIQDYDSGLKRVISSPNEINPRTEFVSGTRNPVTFYYSATCCDTTAKITAIDLLDNYNTRTIDVTVWDNLAGAEIAAITVGVLLIILLIILIITSIVFCVKKKKSHDLPYTQRYGSRPPAAQPERSSF